MRRSGSLRKKIREEEELAQSQGSSTKVPYDASFERALNKVKKFPVSAPPHRGHVVGAGLNHKHSFYYPETKEARKERKRNEEKNVREELETVKADMPNIINAQVTQTMRDESPAGTAPRSSPSISYTP